MKYITVDAGGNINGMYLTDPGNGIALSDEDWQSVGPGYTYVNGVLIAPAAKTDAELLAEAKTNQIGILSAKCQAYLLAGFASSALGNAHMYPSQLTDQQNQASVAASGAGGSLWCETGSVWGFVAHTDAQATQVVADWKIYLNAAQTKLQTLAASVNAATTVAAVQAIGW